jgi:hypothetical protein
MEGWRTFKENSGTDETTCKSLFCSNRVRAIIVASSVLHVENSSRNLER